METKPDYLKEAYDAPRQIYKSFEAMPTPAQPEESKSPQPKRKLIKLHPDSHDSEEIERRKQAAAAQAEDDEDDDGFDII